jgi:hypothetical protein
LLAKINKTCIRREGKKHMRGSVLLVVSLFALSSVARADIFEPTIDKICSPIPNPKTPGRVDPTKLLDRLYESQNLHPINLNSVEPSKIGYAQQVDAIVNAGDFCTRSGHCDDGVAQKLMDARVILSDFFSRHFAPVGPNENGYTFPFKDSNDKETWKQFFSNSNARLAAICFAGTSASGAPKQPAADNKSNASGRVIVRKNIDDLHVGQADPDFKSVQRATFSVTGDRIKHTNSYDVEGVLGYGFGVVPLAGTTSGEIIPFLTYNRQFVDGGSSKDPNIHDVGIGVLGDLHFSPAGLKSDLSFAGKEVHSEISGADVVSGNIIYTPYPDPYFLPGINTPALVGDYWVMLRLQGKFIYGDVINNGGDPNLSATGTFSRVGSRVGLSIVASDDALLKGFSVDAFYEYLKVILGQPSAIGRFESTVTFTFPKQQFWNIQLHYVNGRDLDTLARQQLVTLGVGLKY